MEPQALIEAQWHGIVDQLAQRDGAIDLHIDLDRHPELEEHKNADFRVRLLKVETDGDWLVERPFSMDGSASLRQDMHVIGVVASGPRRFQFSSIVRQVQLHQLNAERRVPVLRLSPPRNVQSAQRRRYYRVSTLSADLPMIRVAPLLELASVLPAERACFEAVRHNKPLADDVPQPRIGRLLNVRPLDISGNGVAVQVGSALKDLFHRCPYFWLEMDLPDLPTTLKLTARVARIDQQPADTLRVGLAFHFSHHPVYRQFVTDHVCHFAAQLQRRQLQRQR